MSIVYNHYRTNQTPISTVITEGDAVSLTGKGTIKYNDCEYEGDIKNGLMHGLGKKTQINGIVFDGEFENNQETKGKLTQVLPNGVKMSFEGNFNDISRETTPFWKNLPYLLFAGGMGVGLASLGVFSVLLKKIAQA